MTTAAPTASLQGVRQQAVTQSPMTANQVLQNLLDIEKRRQDTVAPTAQASTQPKVDRLEIVLKGELDGREVDRVAGVVYGEISRVEQDKMISGFSVNTRIKSG